MLEYKVNEFYLCMNCGKEYDTNPVTCGEPRHSQFSEKYDCTHTESRGDWGGCALENSSDITEWIFRFKEGQYDEYLEGVPQFITQTPQSKLESLRFKVLFHYHYLNRNTEEREKVRKEIGEYIRQLNQEGKAYVLYSVSSFPGATSFTFLKRL